MLVPAFLYKEELLRKFAKEMYSDRYFYYCGWGPDHSLPCIDDSEGRYQWASIGRDDELIGYIAYFIDLTTSCADRFGIYTFEDGYNLARNALTFGKDLDILLEELVNNYHRVSWRVIEGNPVIKTYDKICERYNGNKVHLHDSTVDRYGNRLGEFIYEIISDTH